MISLREIFASAFEDGSSCHCFNYTVRRLVGRKRERVMGKEVASEKMNEGKTDTNHGTVGVSHGWNNENRDQLFKQRMFILTT